MHFKVCLPHVSLLKETSFFLFLINKKIVIDKSVQTFNHKNPHPWKKKIVDENHRVPLLSGSDGVIDRMTDGSGSGNVWSEDVTSCARDDG